MSPTVMVFKPSPGTFMYSVTLTLEITRSQEVVIGIFERHLLWYDLLRYRVELLMVPHNTEITAAVLSVSGTPYHSHAAVV